MLCFQPYELCTQMGEFESVQFRLIVDAGYYESEEYTLYDDDEMELVEMLDIHEAIRGASESLSRFVCIGETIIVNGEHWYIEDVTLNYISDYLCYVHIRLESIDT